MSIEILADHFQQFSQTKYSPLYAELAAFIATQDEILQAMRDVPLHKSPVTILFAAVHALLLKGTKHPLAEFYPSVGGARQLTTEIRPELCAAFLDFFKHYQAEIQPYLLKNTQTNEAKRCMPLLPAFSEIAKRDQHPSISLIEIGSSAGFLLNIDKYSYKINDSVYGNSESKLSFSTKWHGKEPDNLKNGFIKIEKKIGVDINPLDVEDEEVKLWLKALIWPEQIDRLQRFDLTCDVLKQNKKDITILKGRFENYIDQILSMCSASKILCFLSVWVLYQFSPQEKNALNELLSSIAKSSNKKIYFILDDWTLEKASDANNIILREFDREGGYTDSKVCATHHHAEWVNSL